MAAQPTDGMYLFFSIPLGLANLIGQVIGRNQNDPNTPQVAQQTAVRQWFSQPRPAMQDGSDTTEVVQVNFKLPLSISEVGWDAARTGSRFEVWYQDRQNNWRQVLDEARVPVALNLSASSSVAWYTAHYYCYPFVAKALQFRITRVWDQIVGSKPYCVGMRKALIRRNVYTRADGTQGIEPQQDPLGNTFTSYIKDWDAGKAFDNDPVTFWKSQPFPDPNAVAWLGLDCRTPGGGAQSMDTLYIDPVYTGQSLNVYYSNDDTQDTLKLSPISAMPILDENTTWQVGKGRWDSSDPDTGIAAYAFPMSFGPMVSQDMWFGIEWTPDFSATAGPAENPVLFNVTPNAPDGGQWWPKIYYDVGAGQIVLELQNLTAPAKFYRAALSPTLAKNTTYRIVVGWGYSPKTVFISVKTQAGVEVAHLSTADSTLPTLMTLDGTLSYNDWVASHGPYDGNDLQASVGFRGLLTANVIKLENWSVGQTSFQAQPQIYVSPDPVIPDSSGNVPATTLDNAIYAAAWTIQEFGTGGDHASRYEAKQWTPIWKNYYSQKGKLFFGTQINAKYLKLEFTHLSEESYPVYDSGIQTSYTIFPASVTQDQTLHHPGLVGDALGLLTIGADVVLGTLSGVNFLNPSTINNVVNSVFGPIAMPAVVTTGVGQVIAGLPNTSTLDSFAQSRTEVASPAIYKRSPQSATALAGQYLKTAQMGGATSDQGFASAIGTVAGAIFDSFQPLVNFASNPTGLPQQGADWWIFPGATLKLPAIVMNGLTSVAQTVFGRPDTTIRNRFNTTSVHRYDVKTVTRDAAVAYFAGVREVQPYITTYIAEQDPLVFKFDSYDQFVPTNIYRLDSGPVTTAGAMNPEALPSLVGISTDTLLNGNFDGDLANWTATAGTWTYDGAKGHYALGSAKVTATGATKTLLSNAIDVVPGIHHDASVFVNWSGLTATANSHAIALVANYYDSSANFLSSQTVDISYSSWPATTPTSGGTTWQAIEASRADGTGWTVPSNTATMRLALTVTAAATAGTIWFDTVLHGTTDSVVGTLFKDFITTSTFTKVRCKFSDSGTVRSDDMWAREDPNDLNISNTSLAYYTSTIPDVIPAGMWSDNFATWSSDDYTWGDPRAVVAINVDPDRIYDGKRVLHFTRAGGAEEAGIKVRQITNFVSNGLFRIGAVFQKPYANTNQVTVRLRRVSDGVYIHEETFDPVVGYWFTYLTDFFEIPDSPDQEYTVELVLTGDQPDEFYLNDLYCEVAPIRYFVRLGGADQYLHDVTQLRYADSAIVSCTEPVNEFSVQVAIMSPKAYAYSAVLEPAYLK